MQLGSQLESKRQKRRMEIRRLQMSEVLKKRRQQTIEHLISLDNHASVCGKLQFDSSKQLPTTFSWTDFQSNFQQIRQVIKEPSDQPDTILYLKQLVVCLQSAQDQCPGSILQYVLAFIETHKYQSLQAYSHFQSNFILILEQIPQRINSPAINHKIMMWCRDKRSLNVLTRCITQFPNASVYSHVYSIIETAISDPNEDQSHQATLTLVGILNYAQKDDVYCIHERHPNIFLQLINKAYSSSGGYEFLYVQAIIKLLNTYGSTVVSCAHKGLICLIRKYLTSGSKELETDGLLVLNELASVPTKQMGQCLLSPVSMPIWVPMLRLRKSKSSNTRLVYSILACLMSNCTQEGIKRLKMEIEQFQSIISIVRDAFEQFKDQTETVLRALQITKSVLYYVRGGNLAIGFFKSLQEAGLVKYFQDCVVEYPNPISSLAQEIVQIFEYSVELPPDDYDYFLE